jgi:hypothetical protein
MTLCCNDTRSCLGLVHIRQQLAHADGHGCHLNQNKDMMRELKRNQLT